MNICYQTRERGSCDSKTNRSVYLMAHIDMIMMTTFHREDNWWYFWCLHQYNQDYIRMWLMEGKTSWLPLFHFLSLELDQHILEKQIIKIFIQIKIFEWMKKVVIFNRISVNWSLSTFCWNNGKTIREWIGGLL